MRQYILHIDAECGGVYCRHSFNTYGDMVAHLDETALLPEMDKEWQVMRLPVSDTTREVVGIMNDFDTMVDQQGAVAFFSYPAVPQVAYDANRDNVFELDQYLQGNLTMPILSKPERYLVDLEYFYDTQYHLTGDGRLLRTQMLIEDLRSAMASADASH